MILSACRPSPLCSELLPLLWKSSVAAVPTEPLRGCLRWQWGTQAQHLDGDHTKWDSRRGDVRQYSGGNQCSPRTEETGTPDTERDPFQTRNWKFITQRPKKLKLKKAKHVFYILISWTIYKCKSFLAGTTKHSSKCRFRKKYWKRNLQKKKYMK